MAIYDANGTNFTEIGKVYDANGTTFTQIGKVYDNNGTTSSLMYSPDTELLVAGVFKEDYLSSSSYKSNIGTLTYGNGYIQLVVTDNSSKYFGYYVDLTNVKTAYMKCASTQADKYNYSAVGMLLTTNTQADRYSLMSPYNASAYGGGVARKIHTATSSNITIEWDLSSYKGYYYLWFGASAYDGMSTTYKITDFGYKE